MNPPKHEPLSVVIDKLNNHKILLPDFQRRFTWKDEEMQKQFVASVLSKMPLGSILLLEGDATEYAYKEIGSKDRSSSTTTGNVELLLDGQQRITVLATVFSNAIFNTVKQASNLISQNLKRRFFIRIPTYEEIEADKDLFQAKTLKFPFSANGDPSFLTSDIFDLIHVENFNATANHPFNAYCNVKLADLADTCCSNADKGYFLIPLFLLVEDEKGSNRNETCLVNILSDIANSMTNHILEDFDNCEDKEEFIQKTLLEAYYEYIPDSKKADKAAFQTQLQKQNQSWVDNFKAYLKSCVDDISLSQIIVSASQRDRAIDIYENLNRGGVSLDIFDLIMARVAKSYHGDFYNRIVERMKESKFYDANLTPDTIKNQVAKAIQNKYNATIKMSCLSDNDEITPAYIDAFLNVLSFVNNGDNEFKVELTRRDKKLSLSAEFIDDNTDKVCLAIDRAMFFFQSRCGLRSINEINYKLFISIVSYIFYFDDNFNNKAVHDLLEAWYWSTILSGYFDSDQNPRMVEHIGKLKSTIEGMHSGNADVNWIKVLRDDILNAKNFADLDFWLFKDAKNTERVPKAFLRNVVCQYYLSKTYADMFSGDTTLSVFHAEAGSLEKHHIIPLGSAKDIKDSTNALRTDEYNILNSPLNFVYITKADNLAISDKSLKDYQDSLDPKSYSALHFSSLTDTSSDEKIKAILESRFTSLQGEIQARVGQLLPQ